MSSTLTIAPAPHVRGGDTVAQIMWHVVIALLPACGFAIYLFGLAGLVTITAAAASCLVAERLLRRTGASTLADGSALVTGVIYGLTLPPGLPVWMIAAGGVIAIAIGKLLFGGLGYNAFNPALVGRVFLQAAFPTAMTTWLSPLGPDRFTQLPASTLAVPLARSDVGIDAFVGATPLGRLKFDAMDTPLSDLALGLTTGSTGETSAVLLLAGGLYLVARRIANWRIPVAICGTAALVTGLLHVADPAAYPDPRFMLLSGGLMLGAWFMATDPVASPVTRSGAWVYGIVIGLLIVVIRLWSGQPEGVMYAILLGNAVSPHIDRWLQPVPLGRRVRDVGRVP
jgi:Na+-translocating ferredoxin:NAD+ oxidoreductase subunit D